MSRESATYTHGHHESVLRAHTWRTAANSAAYLLPQLKSGMALLDVGCGPGTITTDLAALVAPGRVVAVDFVPAVLEQARKRAEEAGYGDRIEFRAGDVHELDFPDDTFDVVHAHQVLQHVGDPVQALREMRRVCKPGGIVAARDGDYGGIFWYPEIPALDDWQRFYIQVARSNGGEPNAGRQLHAWARAAGFEDIEISSATWCFATPEERRWWGGSWSERSVKSNFAQVAVSGGHATPEQLQQVASGWLQWADEPDGWLTVPHGQIVCRV
jgi:SAM-dependent methyltransferase